MCGRFTISHFIDLAERFELANETVGLEPRYNVAPTQATPVITASGGTRQLAMFRWGLIPNWAPDVSLGYKLINARAETLEAKPSFKNLLQKKRCLVIADGFFEWKKQGASKKPYRFMLKDGGLFAFAGLWDTWVSPAGEILNSYAVVTTAANELVEPLHHRMPAILHKEHEALWLDHNLTDSVMLKNLLLPYPAELMAAYAVGTLVNSPQYDSPAVIQPL